MKKLHLDFESYNAGPNIKKVGAIKYSEDLSCEVIMVGWAIDDEPAKVFVCDGDETPVELMGALNDPEVLIFAHNANFERAIIENVAMRQLGWPKIDVSRYRCTAAIAASVALPRDLKGVGEALQLPQKKYARGAALITKFCMPNKKTGERVTATDAPEDFKEFVRYCQLDVEAERAVDESLITFHLTPKEQKIWELDSEINMRGLPIDYPLILKAIKIVDEYSKRELARAKVLTGGISVTQVIALKAWLISKGHKLESVNVEALTKLLDSENVADDVKEVVSIRMKVGSAAVKKLKKFREVRSDRDTRIRGCLMYHGATTGRWTSKLVQVHNLIRPTIKNPDLIETVILTEDLSTLEMMYENPLEAICSCIRHMICAKEGKIFNVSDYSAIEARVLAWLAGQDDIIKLFEGDGKIYEHTASKIYSKRVEDIVEQERFIGKVATLALGFQGGKNAFRLMASSYGLEISAEAANEIKKDWRKANKAIVKFWDDIQEAAIEAVKTGKTQTVGKIKIGILEGFLIIKLPSGRRLAYPRPEVIKKREPWENGKMVDALTFYGQLGSSRKWGRVDTYGGKLVENITQAVARDIMANGMLKAEDAGYPIVLTVHDEIISETDDDFGSIEEFNQLICDLPKWAEGLPLKAEGYRQRRYKK